MKKAIITGASDGLGLKIAEKLSAKGWRVISLSRSKPKINIKHIKVDLTRPEEIEVASKKIKKDYSEFDCLINCAGILSIQNIENIDYHEIENLFKVNVLAPIKLTSNLMPEIKRNEADVINIGSTIGFKAYQDQCAYGASKWAVQGLNQNLQLELKNTKCRVIGFNPGGFKSKLAEKATGKPINLDAFMDPEYLADLLIYIMELPKELEVSQIIINRK